MKKLLLTCEHAGNTIPEEFKHLFFEPEILNMHKGYDLGALSAFNALKDFADKSIFDTTSRLLIELNRSLTHPNLFSVYTKDLSKAEKQSIINEYYLPYRKRVEQTINHWIENGVTVHHISVHTFTPVFNNLERHCDVGLLYHPKHHSEKEWCQFLKAELKRINPKLYVRFNYPYLGKADGFTSYLRKKYKKGYLGIELEINQKFVVNNVMHSDILKTLQQTLRHFLQQE